MTVSTITKYISLTLEEAKELKGVTERTAASESALMKRWILEGLKTHKLDRAIRAYMEREVDLRGGAAMAGVSYNRFLREVQKRHIVILEDEYFLDRLIELADLFDDGSLRQAAQRVASELD